MKTAIIAILYVALTTAVLLYANSSGAGERTFVEKKGSHFYVTTQFTGTEKEIKIFKAGIKLITDFPKRLCYKSYVKKSLSKGITVHWNGITVTRASCGLKGDGDL